MEEYFYPNPEDRNRSEENLPSENPLEKYIREILNNENNIKKLNEIYRNTTIYSPQIAELEIGEIKAGSETGEINNKFLYALEQLLENLSKESQSKESQEPDFSNVENIGDVIYRIARMINENPEFKRFLQEIQDSLEKTQSSDNEE